ncbi:exodeoxyribonuclease III [Terrarubrum flagellatum]|uniref:exodeoxyribonuclease III n=1 Tax=Terrirubrum flagellatum TaxID=2895980 RepID=UPI003145031B
MRIATWNVNSVRQRVEHLAAWLKERAPDVVCLQEIKCVDDAFPREAIESLGYNVATHGQKTFNGVALLSKFPLADIRRGLPGADDDEQARYIEALIEAPGGVVRVASIYLPNGNPIGTDKFRYKLAWMDRLIAHARELLTLEEAVVLAGDYNVIPQPIDAKNPSLWLGDALFQPESRGALRKLCALGFTEAVRAATDEEGVYSFWDYQAGAWQKNNGIRIDHLLMSPIAADRFLNASVDKYVRGWEKSSDHVPVVIDLAA